MKSIFLLFFSAMTVLAQPQTPGYGGIGLSYVSALPTNCKVGTIVGLTASPFGQYQATAAGPPCTWTLAAAADGTTVHKIINGGTGTASTLTGLVRGSATAMTAAELSADVTTSGSNAAKVVALNNTNLAALATGILKNTTGTGVPSSLAIPLTNANGGTGTASTLTGVVRGGAAMTAAELSGDVTTSGSNAATVVALNGTNLAALGTGIMKNTTATGVPSILAIPLTEANGGTGAANTVGAAGNVLRSNATHYVDSAIQAGDIPTLNQNTTGTAGGLTGTALSNDVSNSGNAITVKGINSTSMAGLGTGIVKNTTGTGVPSIAVAGDFPTLNQNTTGTAGGLTGTALGGDVTNSGNTLTVVSSTNLKGSKIYPSADSTTALQINKADNSTNIVNIDSTNKRVGIGITAPLAPLQIVAPNTGLAANQLFMIESNDSMAINLGGGLGFGGAYTGTTLTQWSAIQGLKENGTDSNFAGYLTLNTRPSPGSLTERLRVTSAGNVVINGTDNGTDKLQVLGTGTVGVAGVVKAAAFQGNGSTPTLAGCTTSAQQGSNTMGKFASGTTGTCTVTFTFATTAPTNWYCQANDITTPADLLHDNGGGSQTTGTISGTTVSGDVIKFACFPY